MENLDQIIRSYISLDNNAQNKLRGVSFVVVDKNGPIYRGSAGRAPMTDQAVTTEDQTWVASLTKLMTTTCLMQLVERGLVSLDEDIRARIPELMEMKILQFDGDGVPELVENTKHITLRHLLTHTVGLGYDLADPDLQRWAKYTGRSTNNLSFTWEGWNTPLRFVPGHGWLYGTAVDWASRLIPALTPMDMGTYMDEHIFRVLEMKSTGFRPQDPNPQCFTRLLNRGIGSGPTPVPAVPPVDSGGAGLYSTAEDYGKFLSAMLSGTLLRQETVDEMFRAQLEGPQYTMFRDAMREHHESMCPWADSSQHLQHGLSGVLNLTAVPGKRKEGSMSWVAMNNCHWWIDRQSGIAAVLVCNLLPFPDTVVNNLYSELERAVYGEFLPSLGAWNAEKACKNR